MSHAHDRTLLNRLGFGDSDRKEPRHDMACRYVARPEILKALFPNALKCEPGTLEYVISKGHGQYKQHIGFADVLASIEERDFFECNCGGRMCQCNQPSYLTEGPVDASRCPQHNPCGRQHYLDRDKNVLIEVKIKPVPISDIVRQIKLYTEYLVSSYAHHRLAVLDFDISESDRLALEAAEIRPVRLGAAFEAWLSKQQAAPALLSAI